MEPKLKFLKSEAQNETCMNKTMNNKNELFHKNSNQILENNIEKLTLDSFIFNGKSFKKYYRDNKYQKEDKILRTVYKCIYHRKDEKLRLQLNQSSFCNATIEYILPNQNQKSGYFFKKDHSKECYNLFNINPISKEVGEKFVEIKDKKKFIEQCENIMNTSEIFDRRLYKDEFKKIYNKFKYNFGINNNFLSNIITNWKLKTNRFKKCSVLDHPKDYNNRLILREFRTLYFNVKNKKEPQKIEYIIWGNEENIRRLRISNHLFIDSTFHHPPEFKQLMIIMYHDIVSNLNIPGIYILMNGKSQIHYDIIFDSIINIITNYHEIDLNINSIVTDSEVALVKSVKKYFPNSLRISCLFHYKQDLMRNIREYGLYKKPDKELSDKIIYKLSILTIKYKGDMNYVKQKLENINTKYTKYQNFINNYFIKEKLKYFEDNSLNYDLVPEKFRINNFLENYNRFIKTKLGEKRIINWINFLHFIKEESERSLNKLINNESNEIDITVSNKENRSLNINNNISNNNTVIINNNKIL